MNILHLIQLTILFFYTLKNSTYLANEKTMETEREREREREKKMMNELNNRKLNNKILLRALSELNNNGQIITI